MKLIFKLLGSLVSLAAGFAGTKLVDMIWKKSTGDQPPKATDDLEHSLRTVLTFALVSAFVSTVIQVLAGRGTQKAIVKYSRTRGEV